jgi:hypothetical protein
VADVSVVNVDELNGEWSREFDQFLAEFAEPIIPFHVSVQFFPAHVAE